MNKQGPNGIEWTDYTWNPIGGCQHGCIWYMPDGARAQCYAKTIAEDRAMKAHYPQGFEAHYWHPERLDEPAKLKAPAKIFLDSMSDLMGSWVSALEIATVLDMCEAAPWHTFQLLTKNAPRLTKYKFPPNVWVGVSAPPSAMFGKLLSEDQQKAMVLKQLNVLNSINVSVRWMSIEPLSFDIAPLLVDCGLQWAVIGAATKGRTIYQPSPYNLERVIRTLDTQGIPVFFKGNLRGNPLTGVWREEFPQIIQKPAESQLTLFGD